MPAPPSNKTELLERMDSGWLRLTAFIQSLTPAQLTGPTDAAGWTVKDHLAHLAAWERSMIYALQGLPRHEGLGVSEETYLNESDALEINAAIYEASRDLPLADVTALMETTHQHLRALVAAMPDEDLSKPYSHFLPDEPGKDDGRPISDRISGNADRHFNEHLAWMERIVNGEPDA